MKIGLDARWIFPEISGIGSYTQDLIRALAITDDVNEYLLYFSRADVQARTSAYANLDNAPNFSSRLIPFGPFSIRNQLVMPSIIRRDQLDIFHSTNFMFPFLPFPPGRRGKIACVVTIYDLIPLLFPEHTPHALKTRFHPVYRRIMREAGRRADMILTISESSREDILKHMTPPNTERDRVVVVYAGVANQFEPADHPERKEKTILYVGRMDPYKNVPGLIRAFSRIVKSGALAARLMIVGPRDARYPEADQIIEQEQLQEFIDWPGYVDEPTIRKAYQEADVFVLPSLYEGFGLPVLEAMASGTPVVCSNRASLPEVAGDAAVLVDPENLDAMKDGILSVLTNPDKAAELRVKGLHRAAQFSWSRTAEETVKAYQRVALDHTHV